MTGTLATTVVAEAELLVGVGSDVALVTLAWSTLFPASGETVTLNVADAPEARVEIVKTSLPLMEPTAGLLAANVGPLVCISLTKIALAGSWLVSVTVLASLGPALCTVMV